MTPPRVFISYSRDSPAHEANVLALANRLRSNGVEAVLDQYEVSPPGGWIQWMKDQIRDAQFILAVCTETYRRRWDGEEETGVGLGAVYEGARILQLLYNAGGANERIIPIVLGASDAIPLELQRYTHFRPTTDEGYDSLYRLLTNQPKIQKPVLGPPLPLREAKPDFRNAFWNAPARNPFFTGRAEHLEAIRSALTHAASAALTQPQAISGLGGIGKTQTAIEYAHRYRDQYAAVLWSGADSGDALLSGFAAIAQLLDLQLKNEADLTVVAASVTRWLQANSGWLLVLDNVEDLALRRDFVPANASGHLLITTRLRATGEFAEPVELEKMAPEEGALFLLRRAKLIAKHDSLDAANEEDRALARQISTELDGLPLALDQAGAFIEEMPSTLAEYLVLYRAEGAELRKRRGDLAPDHPSVTITFSLAFARVVQANPAAGDLVRASAFLAPDAIPEEIFTQSGTEWGEPVAEVAAKPLAWLEAVKEAARFALIRRDAENKSLHIHRLVQEVMKDEMNAETRRTWAERTVQALDEVFPDPEFQNWSQCERLILHTRMAASLLEEFEFEYVGAARLLNQGGIYLHHRGQYAEAEPLFRRSLEIYENVVGPDHHGTAVSLNNLAALFRSQGRFPQAEPLLLRALAINENALGPEHPDTATCLNNLAELDRSQGRCSEAEPLFRRALDIRERAFGSEHPHTAQILNNLALLYCSQGRYPDAEQMHRRTLAIYETALGRDHPETAGSLNNLALVCGSQGRYTEAEPLHIRALAIYEKILGPDHPDTATGLNNLAEIYRRQGRFLEAEPLFRRALAIRESSLGPKHPKTATSLNNLALLYHSQRRYSEAEALYVRALAIFEKTLGPEHPEAISTLNNLATLLRDLDHSDEADQLEARTKTEGD